MSTHYPLMVQRPASDTPVATPGTIEVHSPYDGALLATVETLDQDGAKQALESAYQLFRQRQHWLSGPERLAILERFAQLLSANGERLVAIAAAEGGKPLIDSRVEMNRAIDGVRLCAECLRNNGGDEIPMGINAASLNRLAVTHREPIGVVLAFSAFNHPINLIVHQVGPAIAAGCPVLVKPASETPMSCFELVKLLYEAGLPEAWCQAFCSSGHDVSEALVADPRVGFFSFIGSAAVGWRLRSLLAPGARCALEHGGIAPVILAEDADLNTAIPLLAKGGFYHAGQVCISVQRVFAPQALAREVAEGLAAAGATMRIGNPLTEDTGIGPIIRDQERQRIDRWVQEAISGGAELICGGQCLPNNSYAATVLLDPPASAQISHEEVFGPVIAVYSYGHIDEAITAANSVDFAFQAAVFTASIDTAMHAYRQLDASAVIVNDQTAFRVDWMPFAGLRLAGHGVGGIPHTFAEMQVEKMLVIKSSSL